MARELFSANAETQEQAFLKISQSLRDLKKTYTQSGPNKTDQIIQNMNKLLQLGRLIEYMFDDDYAYFKMAILNYDIRLVTYLFSVMPDTDHFAMFTQSDLWKFSQGAIKLSSREYAVHSEAVRQILGAIFMLEVRNDPENQTFVVDTRKGLQGQEEEPSYQAFVADLNAAAAEAKAVYDQEETVDTSNSRSPHLFGSHSVSQANHTGVNLSFRK